MDIGQTAPSHLAHRVMVVDDDSNLRKVIATNLELEGFDVVNAESGAEALAQLRAQTVDLVLLDVMMPQMDGYEVAQRIRDHANPLISHVPIIMLTSMGETEDKLSGFTAGADDYITKPFGPQELIARVRAKIRRVQVDASLSPLTRLPGNLLIESKLRSRIASGTPFAVLYLDLDSFKAFNDVYGFTHGDEAIKLVADIAVDVVQRRGTPDDFVGHIGGDDFVVATLPERSEQIAQEILANFDREIRALYNAQDLQQGYLETRDRRGTVKRFPIMSLSIAIISNDQRPLLNYTEIGEAAAELKRHAKSLHGSVFVRDKRRS
jgi:diguanylate cyclase (GGDEF)-like protein